MKSTSKWYLLAPALAALLILGPLSMQSAPSSPAAKDPPVSKAETAPAATDEVVRPPRPMLVPKSPDLLQMFSALAGVLLLGVGGLFALRRLRGGATPTRGSNLVTLRQTLRLSARQAMHAIEFDDRILLIGEHERGLVLLDSGRLPERVHDEREVLARVDAIADDADEDGAVPKNLIIPRPATKPSRSLPRAAQNLAPNPAQNSAARDRTPLGDFRALLQKAGRA